MRRKEQGNHPFSEQDVTVEILNNPWESQLHDSEVSEILVRAVMLSTINEVVALNAPIRRLGRTIIDQVVVGGWAFGVVTPPMRKESISCPDMAIIRIGAVPDDEQPTGLLAAADWEYLTSCGDVVEGKYLPLDVGVAGMIYKVGNRRTSQRHYSPTANVVRWGFSPDSRLISGQVEANISRELRNELSAA